MLKRENERKPGKRRNNVLAGRGRLGYTYISVDLDFMKLTAVLIRRRGKSGCRDKQAFRMQRKSLFGCAEGGRWEVVVLLPKRKSVVLTVSPSHVSYFVHHNKWFLCIIHRYMGIPDSDIDY